MTDKELLELAAKAAGLTWSKSKDITHDGLWIIKPSIKTYWNPITDDGDAQRLAVRLKMKVEGWFNGELECARADCKAALVSEPHNGDPYAATRRAITRAAAEIGKAMP
jgi:hypothetical protein